MASKGKPSPRSAVKPLSDEQVARLDAKHHLVDPTRYYPTGPRTHVTMYDVFVPMMSLFHMGRRPRYMAKAEMAKWPLIGKWFQLVGMQPVPRRSGQAKAIEEESIKIITSGRPLTIWPEGTVTRDPQKWVMSLKPGIGYIALESSRRLGRQVPIFCAVTWGAASINQWWPWPRKNVVMCYDEQLDYADLLADMDSWGEEPPADKVSELTMRVFRRMNEVMEEIRGERMPAEGYWDYRTAPVRRAAGVPCIPAGRMTADLET